jgi:hypothetical protein
VPVDLTLSFFYASLGLSAAAVVLFLRLMKEPRETQDGRRETKERD